MLGQVSLEKIPRHDEISRTWKRSSRSSKTGRPFHFSSFEHAFLLDEKSLHGALFGHSEHARRSVHERERGSIRGREPEIIRDDATKKISDAFTGRSPRVTAHGNSPSSGTRRAVSRIDSSKTSNYHHNSYLEANYTALKLHF